jgi:hypothetical protein
MKQLKGIRFIDDQSSNDHSVLVHVSSSEATVEGTDVKASSHRRPFPETVRITCRKGAAAAIFVVLDETVTSVFPDKRIRTKGAKNSRLMVNAYLRTRLALLTRSKRSSIRRIRSDIISNTSSRICRSTNIGRRREVRIPRSHRICRRKGNFSIP